MKIKEVLKISSVPVAIASLCCLSPVIIVLLGIGSVSFASSLADTLYGDYKWVFRSLGLLALSGALVLYLRRTKGICTLDEAKKRRNEIINIVAITLAAAVLGYIFFLYVVVHYAGVFLHLWGAAPVAAIAQQEKMLPQNTKTAIFAGGCFWCVESDLEKIPEVYSVVSGYSGGTSESPTYKDYGSSGHREVVEVTYDANKTSFMELATYLVRHIDPTDGEGSFYDRGKQYAPALYFENEEEKKIIEEVLAEIEESGVYDKPLAVDVLPRAPFWPAEEYHQDYAEKNPLRYAYYRRGSGRDAFIEEHSANYTKPTDAELRKILTPLQYKVTQQDGTETPFDNEYWNNHEEGIYVDVVSGEPLFSSMDKFDSGTGWPSFLAPLDKSFVTEHSDYKLLQKRIEIRSSKADSHLGHIIMDGPESNNKVRYCMNSASLRFVPKEELKREGYEEYAILFE